MTPPLSPSDSARPRDSTRPLAVAVIGAGAIGGAVADALCRGDVPGARLSAVLRSGSTREEVTAAIDLADVLVEAAGVEVAEEFTPRITGVGKDVVVCSCGVFARHEHPQDILAGGSGRVLVPAGAVGGLDVLAAAARAGTDEAILRHSTIKSPAALGVDGPLGAPREVFRGSAREAALEFPRTSNASVALALATIGLDRVEVIVVADPEVDRTRHVVEWESPVGRYDMRFENAVDPDSGGLTSAITAWSVAGVLTSIRAGAGPGVVVVGAARPVEGTSATP
ncbi:MAG: aspartate dehydrogenase domain-containing protein [Dietzia sp.]